jgi:hypothetical protein
LIWLTINSAALRPGIPYAAAGPEVKVKTPKPTSAGFPVCAKAGVTAATKTAAASDFRNVMRVTSPDGRRISPERQLL